AWRDSDRTDCPYLIPRRQIPIRSRTVSQLNADDSSYVQIFEPAQLSLQTSSGTGPERVTQFANPWHSRCLKCFEFENASKKMNTSQNKIPIVEIGEANFESEVLRWKQPVLVAFSAAWSRPCRILDSVLEEVAAACAGREKVVKINADNNPDLSLVWNIQSIP